MQLKISPVIAATILATFIPHASAHCKFVDAWGDVTQANRGSGMLFDINVPMNGGAQNPFQLDVTVFSDPIVPPVPGHPLYGKRKWMQDGCGATLSTANLWRKMYDHIGWGKLSEWDMNYHWYMNYLPKAKEAFVQTLWELSKAEKANRVPQCSPGGWLYIQVHRVNQDGAGPFRCRIDTDGEGKYSIDAKIITQVSGNGGIECCKDQWKFPLKIAIPEDIQCNIKSGSTKNICVMRCENSAPNGPFGGCIPFQVPKQKQKPVEYSEPELITSPDYGYAGYDVGKGNTRDGYKAKRDIVKKLERRHANADPSPKDVGSPEDATRAPEN
ncbi:hypothetical protein TWF481_011458 [Arthrobotrys musiformis]|uniref:Uncharacterized protein n=1 Tax=Arthrobotrys musiformis TaxID=47236 RepID=A0AAV9VZU3_9PEZI